MNDKYQDLSNLTLSEDVNSDLPKAINCTVLDILGLDILTLDILGTTRALSNRDLAAYH